MKKFDSVKDELIYLANKYDLTLSPQKVVDFAKNENTHLHSKFEWDDKKAGHAYRVWQARQIIALEFAVIKRNDIEMGPVRLFVSLKDDRKRDGGYRLITNVIDDEVLRKRMVEEALNEFIRVRDRYRTLNELNDVFEAISHAETLIFETAKTA